MKVKLKARFRLFRFQICKKSYNQGENSSNPHSNFFDISFKIYSIVRSQNCHVFIYKFFTLWLVGNNDSSVVAFRILTRDVPGSNPGKVLYIYLSIPFRPLGRQQLAQREKRRKREKIPFTFFNLFQNCFYGIHLCYTFPTLKIPFGMYNNDIPLLHLQYPGVVKV